MTTRQQIFLGLAISFLGSLILSSITYADPSHVCTVTSTGTVIQGYWVSFNLDGNPIKSYWCSSNNNLVQNASDCAPGSTAVADGILGGYQCIDCTDAFQSAMADVQQTVATGTCVYVN